jgi:phosphohistidine phosphatase
MKTLYLVRHAKSSWKDTSINDTDRPLNKRGKKDAPFMAKLLAKTNEKPERFISSPAVRAYTTAMIIAEGLNPGIEVIKEPLLYLADKNTMLSVIRKIENTFCSLMLFAHNPGITTLSNYLSGSDLVNIPTCGIVKLKFKYDNWSELEKDSCEPGWFEYPKKYFQYNVD